MLLQPVVSPQSYHAGLEMFREELHHRPGRLDTAVKIRAAEAISGQDEVWMIWQGDGSGLAWVGPVDLTVEPLQTFSFIRGRERGKELLEGLL